MICLRLTLGYFSEFLVTDHRVPLADGSPCAEEVSLKGSGQLREFLRQLLEDRIRHAARGQTDENNAEPRRGPWRCEPHCRGLVWPQEGLRSRNATGADPEEPESPDSVPSPCCRTCLRISAAEEGL